MKLYYLMFYLAMLFATKSNGCSRTPTSYPGRPDTLHWHYTASSIRVNVVFELYLLSYIKSLINKLFNMIKLAINYPIQICCR